jgi:NADPH2:quinone reductase
VKAIRVEQQGPPEVLVLVEVEDPRPGPGQVLVGLHASGVNMIDVQQRSGGYQVAVPFTPGTEGAGEVLEVGSDVEGWTSGDRVAYAGVPGAYAELAIVPAARLVPVPAEVATDLAAAVLLQGMTAHYLLHSIVPLRGGEVVVVQAAAGGVGLLLTQMATAAGVHVIGTTSTDEKAALVRSAGAVDVVVRDHDDLAAIVTERTDGAGARIVFDSVGRDTFDGSLGALARRGCLALFGQSSGPVPPLDLSRLQKAGSVFVTRPGLADYVATREELLERADAVMTMVANGNLDVRIHERFPLARADEAHRLLQSGTTAGKLLLVRKEEP